MRWIKALDAFRQATVTATVLLAALLTMPARADPATTGMVPIGDGRYVKLADIVFTERGVEPHQVDLAHFSASANGSISGAADIKVRVVGVDRYRREVAAVDGAHGKGLAVTMVSQGLAYALPVHLENDAAIALLAAEDTARSARKGIWAVPSLAVQRAADLRADPPRFVVVEGDVGSVTKRGGTVYLDFGDDWRKDFTVRVSVNAARQLKNRGIDVASLEGSHIRVRGWVFWWFGPMIDIEQRHALEILPRS